MNSILYKIFFFLFIVQCMGSCKKFLQVKPKDEFLEETVYSNERSIYNTVNGIYMDLAGSALYGGNMTMTAVDLMAQYYSQNHLENNDWLSVIEYGYTQNYNMSVFSGVWQNAYRTMLNINYFLARVKSVPASILPADKKDLLMGEAYGLRAMLHFDMLRLFGPVMATGAGDLSIPYVVTASKDIQKLLPANIVIDSVLSDLNKAAALLANDPVRTEGVQKFAENSVVNSFFKMRNHRMNYYAVWALKARVALYKNDKTAALEYAQKIITEASSFFPWSPEDASLPGLADPDRIFSSEILFGIENVNLYNMQRDYFSSALTEGEIFAPESENLQTIYTSENDYRYRSSWILDQTTVKAYRTFFKFNDVIDRESPVRFFQPLIRMSEMYYIASECTADPDAAIQYLNTVRTNRGLIELPATADLKTELTKEYTREFWGEGQLFFYYKRNNFSSIPDGTEPGSFITMPAKNYKVPLPLSETDNR